VRKLILLLAILLTVTACSSSPTNRLPTADRVDLDRFMGDWYVIASIPTFIETDAYNAVESYQRADDGSIATTFTFREGGFSGKLKTYRPTGYVKPDTNNVIWGMQFVWPIRADYQIAYVDDAYQSTIIARQKRDYVWIMARTPAVSDETYDALVSRVAELGYDIEEIRRVPHRWPDDRATGTRSDES
jgi:apolipoprotein D and lipocalin family protein